MYDTVRFFDRFGSWLHDYRKKNKLRLKDICDAGNFTRLQVRYWERQKCLPTLESAMRLANGLGLRLDEMIDKCMKDGDSDGETD